MPEQWTREKLGDALQIPSYYQTDLYWDNVRVEKILELLNSRSETGEAVELREGFGMRP